MALFQPDDKKHPKISGHGVLLFFGVLITCVLVFSIHLPVAAVQKTVKVDDTKETPSPHSLQSFRKDVQPLLESRCFRCHNKKTKKGKLDLTGLDPDMVKGKDAETWHDVLNRINLGEMPPETAKQFNDKERETIVGWLNAELKRAIAARRSTGGKVIMRRLTRYEYANTMRDLLGVDMEYAKNLPPEAYSPDGFKNHGATLAVAPLHIETYLKTARTALKKAIVVGKRPEVFTHLAKKSVSAKGRKNKKTSNLVSPGTTFLARVMKFPREGDFLVRIQASADISDNAPFPRMRVSVGVKADTKTPVKTLGEADITQSGKSPQTFEFRGRIENFPIPGLRPKYPGLLIQVSNVTDGVKPSQKKNKKNAKNKKQAGEKSVTPDFLVHSVHFEGPYFRNWPPPSHANIFIDSKDKNEEAVYARQIVANFITRAYRRPATKADIDGVMSFYKKIRPKYESLEETMQEALCLVLISPDFLYMVEPSANQKNPQPLTNYELATRLSYLLWSSMPDDKLFRLAKDGKLHDPKVLEKQVRTMIADPKSEQFVEHFTTQWLDLSALDRIAVNPEYYPNFDDKLKVDMKEETLRYFSKLLHEDRSALQLIDSDFVMVNRPLAKHYGLTGPRGKAFESVKVGREDHRGGLLTQGSTLLSNSTGEDSHPIKRAVWLLDRLLDSPPAPPPPDVPEIDPDEPDFAGLSVRKQLELHRKKSACNNCHRGIDPWGIPFESFDAVGNWRTRIAKPISKKRNAKLKVQPVEANSTLPNGTTINGLDELKKYILAHEKQRFSEAVVRRMLTYALGRSLELSDRETVAALCREFSERDYRLSDLVVAIVKSEPFRTK